MTMEKIYKKLIKTDSIGIFHSSREDIRTLAKTINMLIEKVNELIEENNRLNDIINQRSKTAL
jgi:FtsZ-binding cell division protein ZapB